MKERVKRDSSRRSSQPLRFAHPFYTSQPVAARKPVPGVGTRLVDHIKGNLEPIPAPTRTPSMTLADIIGTQGSMDIENSGAIRFHAVGDTGRSANSPQARSSCGDRPVNRRVYGAKQIDRQATRNPGQMPIRAEQPEPGSRLLHGVVRSWK